MCIIIATDHSNLLPDKATFQRCWDRNPHGGGLMYAHEGKLILDKGHMTFDALWEARKRIPKDVPCVVHFRFATHGARDGTMTHPFLVRHGVGMAHNGVFRVPIAKDEEASLSDTAMVARMCSRFPLGFYMKKEWQWLLEEVCGYGNKLVFLDASGNLEIINQSKGTIDSGCWYSNDCFRAPREWTTTGTFFPSPWELKGRKKKKEPKLYGAWVIPEISSTDDPHAASQALIEYGD